MNTPWLPGKKCQVIQVIQVSYVSHIWSSWFSCRIGWGGKKHTGEGSGGEGGVFVKAETGRTSWGEIEVKLKASGDGMVVVIKLMARWGVMVVVKLMTAHRPWICVLRRGLGRARSPQGEATCGTAPPTPAQWHHTVHNNIIHYNVIHYNVIHYNVVHKIMNNKHSFSLTANMINKSSMSWRFVSVMCEGSKRNPKEVGGIQ